MNIQQLIENIGERAKMDQKPEIAKIYDDLYNEFRSCDDYAEKLADYSSPSLEHLREKFFPNKNGTSICNRGGKVVVVKHGQVIASQG